MKPFQRPDRSIRFKKWLDTHKADIEMKIVDAGLGRIWTRKKIEYMENWVFDHPKKGDKKDWRTFCLSWLTRDWAEIDEPERERLRAQRPDESQEPNYDGPPTP